MKNSSNDIDELIMQLWENRYFKTNVDPRKIEVEFYSYTTLKNTIRKRQDRILIRISDMLNDAPKDILWALLIILFCKLENRSPPRSQLLSYKKYVNSKKMRDRIRKRRKERVKKEWMGPAGKHHNLVVLCIKILGVSVPADI